MLTNKELTRVEPQAFVRRMLRDFDRFFEEGWTPFAAPARVFGEFAWTPTLEVIGKNHQLVARFELPGLKKEEITVTVAEDQFTVEGERKLEEEEKKHNWYLAERAYGKFVRTVPLPVGIESCRRQGNLRKRRPRGRGAPSSDSRRRATESRDRR